MSQGVLLLAHGTPDSLDQMPEYLARVRGGRPPSPALRRQPLGLAPGHTGLDIAALARVEVDPAAEEQRLGLRQTGASMHEQVIESAPDLARLLVSERLQSMSRQR